MQSCGYKHKLQHHYVSVANIDHELLAETTSTAYYMQKKLLVRHKTHSLAQLVNHVPACARLATHVYDEK